MPYMTEEEKTAVEEEVKKVPDPVTLALMKMNEDLSNGIGKLNARIDALEARDEKPTEAKPEPEPVEVEEPETESSDEPVPDRAVKPERRRKVRIGRNRTAGSKK